MRDKIAKVIRRVNRLLIKSAAVSPPDFSAVNKFVAMPHYKDEEPAVPLAVLRSTYVVRTRLPSWIGLRDATKAEFDRRGLDTKKLLYGLFAGE